MLGNLLDLVGEQARAAARLQAAQTQAAQLEAAVAQQHAQLQVDQFRRQANAADQQPRLDPDIADLADHFSLDESIARALDAVMQNRSESFEADMLTLWDVLERSDNPSATLTEKIGELASGTFVAKSKTHDDVVSFCRRYELDHTATKNLIEALAVRERDHEANIKKDLERLAVHMEHSSAPSKLISMKLKEIRGGCNIAAVWHCCGDSRKRGREKIKEPPPDGGPGLEGVQGPDRGFRQRQGAYKSYTDRELVQRFGDGVHDRLESGGLMTEAQAMNFQRHMRQEQAAAQSRSQRRSRSRGRRSRRSSGRSQSGGRRRSYRHHGRR
mmetsp:Transcript_109906/g.218304  ORF Transcript_109906/g.218304 Transcript_109906/m.218304 type:complete len:328 (+) Transcript_109906:73-1056(+)